MEYASRAVGNAGLTTGVIGTALGVLNGAGGIGELIGAGTRPRGPQNEGDIPVTRHDKLNARMDMQFNGVQQQLNAQAVWNATQQGTLGCLQAQIAQLQSMTQLVIPNKSVMPGWGPVEISAPGDVAATTGTGTNG